MKQILYTNTSIILNSHNKYVINMHGQIDSYEKAYIQFIANQNNSAKVDP